MACPIFQRPLPSWLPQRFAICVLAHLGFVLLYIMRSNMSVAIVRMTTPYAVLVGDNLTSVGILIKYSLLALIDFQGTDFLSI